VSESAQTDAVERSPDLRVSDKKGLSIGEKRSDPLLSTLRAMSRRRSSQEYGTFLILFLILSLTLPPEPS
jgi:hypothetical protein